MKKTKKIMKNIIYVNVNIQILKKKKLLDVMYRKRMRRERRDKEYI